VFGSLTDASANRVACRSYDYLKTIKQPTLVVNGNKDLIIYTVNSFILQQNIPNAQLILYPDSNHGSGRGTGKHEQKGL
jgi:pimeloyl-ACP methyl ester carboxylesterase